MANDNTPFHLTDNGIAATQGRLSNFDAAKVDSAREAHGLAPVPAELRAKRVGRGSMKTPPPISNGKGPCC